MINYNFNLNSHTFIAHIVYYYIVDISSQGFLKFNKYIAYKATIKLYIAVLQLPFQFIVFTCFSLTDVVCTAIWNAYCGLQNTSLKPVETKYITGSNGHIKSILSTYLPKSP